ncbi:hypothetical protein ACFX2B_009678 [Malus domestica]
MEASRNLAGDARRLPRDEENAKEDDWSTGKKLKSERFSLLRWELTVALAVDVVFSIGRSCVYLTMPAAEYGKLKLPHTIVDLRLLKLQLLIRDLETDGAPPFFEFSFAGQSIHLNHFLRKKKTLSVPRTLSETPQFPKPKLSICGVRFQGLIFFPFKVLGFSAPSRLTGIPHSPNREEEDWYHYHRHRRQGRAISQCEICDLGIRIRQTGMRRKRVSVCRSLCVAGH